MLVIIGVRQVGKQDTTRLASIIGKGYAASPQACWYGICPGRTSQQTAIRVLANGARVIQDITLGEAGYLIPYDACITFMLPNWSPCLRPEPSTQPDIHSTMVRINLLDSNIYLSEVIAQFGAPAHIWICSGVSSDFVAGDVGGVTVSVQYSNGVSFTAFKVSKYSPPIYPMSPEEWRVSKDMKVARVYFESAQSYMSEVDNEVYFAWRGVAEGPALSYSCGN